MSSKTFLLTVSLSVTLAFVLGGCGRDSDAAKANPYSKEIEQAASVVTDSFSSKILADGTITDLEMGEARQKLLDCLDSENIVAEFINQDGSYQLVVKNNVSELPQVCTKNFYPLQSLYQKMQGNPDNINPDDLFAACFVRHKLAPKGFTGSDLNQIYEDGNLPKISSEDLEEGKKVPVPELTLPGGKILTGDNTDPEVEHCLTNPQW